VQTVRHETLLTWQAVPDGQAHALKKQALRESLVTQARVVRPRSSQTVPKPAQPRLTHSAQNGQVTPQSVGAVKSERQ
jgi:hypothetical protein